MLNRTRFFLIGRNQVFWDNCSFRVKDSAISMHSLPKRPQVNLNSIEENKSNMNLKNEKKSEDAIVESILLAKEQLITVS